MSQQSQFKLLGERRFAPFFLVQFLGAGNDNIFKFAFTVLATYHAAEWGGLDPKIAGAVIGGLFILPFLLFSATSGQIADRYAKDALIRFVKNLEIFIAIIIASGFIMKWPMMLFLSVFMMGLHSTLFGPVKFSYLPQHLHESELTGGNGLMEMGTFVAILLGTMLGGALIDIPGNGPWYVAIVTVVVAVAGRIAASFVPASAAADPGLRINWNPVTETLTNLRYAKQSRVVFLSMLGISWLWFFGSIFLTSFTGFAKDVLGGNPEVVTLLLATFSIGIAVGSLMCEKMSGHKVEIGLVPFGSIGMTVFAVDLYFASRGLTPTGLVGAREFIHQPANIRVMADLFLLAMFAGFYSVPLYALIQSRTEKSHVARVIAANNILNALFMVVASLMAAVLLGHAVGLTLPQLFLVTALLNALVAVYIYTLVPEFLMRFLCWLLISTVYRVKKEGLENIPDEGAAVLVCNHVSFVDALVITAACHRPIRFVMDHQIFKIPVLSFIFRTGKAIPIASAKVDEALLNRAYDSVAEALEQGELVCIFPEGRITDNGDLYPFKSGIKRIIDRTPVPVVPLALRGLWGSFFSRKGGPAMTKPFRRGAFSRIGLVAAPAIPPGNVTSDGLQAQVLAMRGDQR